MDSCSFEIYINLYVCCMKRLNERWNIRRTFGQGEFLSGPKYTINLALWMKSNLWFVNMSKVSKFWHFFNLQIQLNFWLSLIVKNIKQPGTLFLNALFLQSKWKLDNKFLPKNEETFIPKPDCCWTIRYEGCISYSGGKIKWQVTWCILSSCQALTWHLLTASVMICTKQKLDICAG